MTDREPEGGPARGLAYGLLFSAPLWAAIIYSTGRACGWW